jgi:hypothetical protein
MMEVELSGYQNCRLKSAGAEVVGGCQSRSQVATVNDVVVG